MVTAAAPAVAPDLLQQSGPDLVHERSDVGLAEERAVLEAQVERRDQRAIALAENPVEDVVGLLLSALEPQDERVPRLD